MSRWIDIEPKHGIIKEVIASMKECRNQINEVCCDAFSPKCGYLIGDGDCKDCPHFVEEDGIITDAEEETSCSNDSGDAAVYKKLAKTEPVRY